MKEKIAIVASGGGMGCSYAAGAISALARHYKFLNPDMVLAGSGSTGTLTYYVSGQHDCIFPIWSEILTSKKFVNLKRVWKVMDVDYLIDDIFKKQFPLDVDAVHDSPTKIFIATTNCQTGELEYFCNDDRFSKNDIFELLRASKSIPILYGKKVPVNGGRYCDTYLSSSISCHIKKAVDLGASKIIAINNDIRRRFNEKVFNIWLATRNRGFRKNYNAQYSFLSKYKAPKEVEVIFIQPKFALKVGTINNKKGDLAKTIKMGWDDAVNNKRLEEILKRS